MSPASIRRAFIVLWLAFTTTVLLAPVAAQQPRGFASPPWTVESVSPSHTPSIAGVTAESGSGGQVGARPCLSASLSQLSSDASRYGGGLRRLPRNMAARNNLKWEVPVALATVALIEGVDSHVSNQVKSGSFNTASDNASNVVLGAAVGVVALDYVYGCVKRREHARRAGFAALEAAGYGIGADLVLKAMFNREYPDKFNGDGRFWHGGKSFPSGHAATAWAL
ncbi:MAG TPA: hypothetical protein VFM10_10535, partial [Terriglobales bacterium]|nr:hypothetical protein [Terriglobales bacterium]